MNEVRTLEQLVDATDADLAWRKHELSAWSTLLSRTDPPQRDAYLRGAWALLYAHWEGFVKSAATMYLEYVSRQGLTIEALSDSLVAVAMRGAISSAVESRHGSAHTQLVSSIRAGRAKARLPFDSATVKTNANLKFDAFAEVLWSVGCDPEPFRSIQTDIDKSLLRNRNDIAHGKYLVVDIEDWDALRAKVVQTLDEVRTQLQNAASQGDYKRQ